MESNYRREKAKDWEAAALLRALMTDRGWEAPQVEQASKRRGIGHPQRIASQRTVHRVLSKGCVPLSPCQFEIASVFGLLPSHIWGGVPLPEPYAYLNARSRLNAHTLLAVA